MNPLDAFAKLVLNLYGIDTEALRQEQAADKRRAQNRKPINAKGQTSAINKQGNVRDFRNVKQSLTRPPTLDPVQTRGTQAATPPRQPPGGFGQAPGQMNLFGNNPSAVPGGRFRAPSIPNQLAIGAGSAAGRTLLGTVAGGVIPNLARAGLTWAALEGLAPAPAGDATLDAMGVQPRQSYSGMEDMSGDPIRPEVPMGRPDPFAPVDYTPPEQSYAPVPQAAPAAAPKPRVPSRKQVVNDAYDALRAQLNAGQINAETFRKEGLRMHKEYFNKK